MENMADAFMRGLEFRRQLQEQKLIPNDLIALQQYLQAQQNYPQQVQESINAQNQMQQIASTMNPLLATQMTGALSPMGGISAMASMPFAQQQLAGAPFRPSMPRQPTLPKFKSQLGQELAGRFLLEQAKASSQPEGFTLSEGQTRYDIQGRPIVTAPKKAEPSEIPQTEEGLRKEFDKLSEPYRDVRDSYGRILAAAKDPSPAGDLAIIFNYMKMLDPRSVVRESEFATAENAAGVPVQIRNMWNRMRSGERLAFNRQDFINQANALFKAQEKTQKDLGIRYTNLSKKYGVNPENVITEPTKFENEISIQNIRTPEQERRYQELLKKAGGK